MSEIQTSQVNYLFSKITRLLYGSLYWAQFVKPMERDKGFEPSRLAWEANMLPLNINLALSTSLLLFYYNDVSII